MPCRPVHLSLCVALAASACSPAAGDGGEKVEAAPDAHLLELLPDGGQPDTSAGRADRKEPDATRAPDAVIPSAPCPAGALLCDDFEGATLDRKKWTTTT